MARFFRDALFMFIDSHCHLDFPELADRLPEVLQKMQDNQVSHALCVSVTLPEFPKVLALAETYPHLYASAGVHPDYEDTDEPTVDQLVQLAAHPRIVAIGETGLDYYRLTGDLEWQRERFRVHIRSSVQTRKPLIVHTRAAADDTLRILQDEGAGIDNGGVGGVMHCFTESLQVAEAAMALGFYISFSGIVTFKSAQALREVAARVPDDRLLIETDSPYLAPVPHRGRINEPSFVPHVATVLAQVRNTDVDRIAALTTRNFQRTFRVRDEELSGAPA